jgi:uncharacterized protein involved in exopolysaccharide biosynthesis
MPEQLGSGGQYDQIDLLKLLRVIRRGTLKIIGVTAFFVCAAVAYAILATNWYRAEVLLAPADEKSAPSLVGQLGGLAALAGVNVGGGNSAEAIATLESRDFARNFIEDRGLLTVFFARDWDDINKRWREQDPRKQPDMRDAIRYFREKVLRVSEDRKTSFVTLGVEWTDPDVAADWATDLAKRLNQRLREMALREAEVNVEYLRQELASTNVVTLQQAIGRLLESELQKLMLARGNEEFAFRVIDKAYPPRDPVRPKPMLLILAGLVLGVAVGIGIALATGYRAHS